MMDVETLAGFVIGWSVGWIIGAGLCVWYDSLAYRKGLWPYDL